jgi:organic hydroperoxide reductase OsmC/OhrA
MYWMQSMTMSASGASSRQPIRWRDRRRSVHLTLAAKIAGADKAKFEELAGKAKAGCPVSKLLNTKITLDATLSSWAAL